ncbi:MAG: hypothetical protein NTV93_15335 [Verrucomicrobia bacterium]|nr:hypothetical protein [Verrucomicrobiota bacterium]
MIPDPLHPAVVHFPIVLLLLGAPLAVVAVFVRCWNLPVLAAVVLVLGAAGAAVATWTGGEAAELAGELNGGGEQVLDEHEEWGERARNAGIVAALLAVTSAALFRKPVAARAVGPAAALAAIAAAFSVAQAGHYGGQVVYKHGVGINTAAVATTQGGTEPGQGRKQGDDD